MEYTSTATNSNSCYSSIPNYGNGGLIKPIVAPTPSTVRPLIHKFLPQHKSPIYVRPEDIDQCKNKCCDYKTVYNDC